MVILAVSPHPDDVEIGCFGTLARLSASEPVVIVVMTSGEVRGAAEDREQEALASAKLINAKVEFLHHPDGTLVQNATTVGELRALLTRLHAKRLFAPFGEDMHQDHTASYRIAVAAATDAEEILLYETPSTVGFHPNVFYDVGSTLSVKLAALALFKSQADRPYLDASLVEGQARYFALRLRRKGGAFEAFALHRSVR